MRFTLQTHCVFLTNSNVGGDLVAEKALEFWKAGANREEIELKDLEMALSISVFNNKKSKLMSHLCHPNSISSKRSSMGLSLNTSMFPIMSSVKLCWFLPYRSLGFSRWLLALQSDRKSTGGLLCSIPASRVQTCGHVCQGRDGQQGTGA